MSSNYFAERDPFNVKLTDPIYGQDTECQSLKQENAKHQLKIILKVLVKKPETSSYVVPSSPPPPPPPEQ